MGSIALTLLALAVVRVLTWGPDHRLLWPLRVGEPGLLKPPSFDALPDVPHGAE